MKVLIIDEDQNASKNLENMLIQYDESISIFKKFDSDKINVQWFNINFNPDIVFLDIKLANKLGFDIFEQIILNCPIVFTTEHDENAKGTFDLNAVDYLIKPYEYDELKALIDRFKKTFLADKTSIENPRTDAMDNVMKILSKEYKKRFVVNTNEGIESISTKEILIFHRSESKTYLYTKRREKYTIDYSMELLETLLNPANFFRVSHNFFVSRDAILFVDQEDDRIKIKLKHGPERQIWVDKERIGEFNSWYEED